MAIAAMLVFSIVGMVVYIFSKDMFGDAVSLVFLKLYTTATIVQWILLVDLVH
ncbi:hypothetical protein BCR44DRAFT_1439010 [Catenaria anguillulae PL171]|uniref:Uncharacterized protein n=1 Tax=Catenaria anguillulae PL171 TaxID=765915 RepID=A0A1Y2HES8_9FUNG|nr:hypothetical protein BCR44DRAFT_1439010 [Catenaria anguillulae PL171]